MFQSTRPHGARLELKTYAKRVEVSIHAPARGATLALDREQSLQSFNPRARTGRDVLFYKYLLEG